MAAVTNLNTGATVQNKIFNDAQSSSVTYGNVRQRVITGTLSSNNTAQINDAVRIKPADVSMVEVYLTAFATDGTNSSQILTVYYSISQLVSGGAMFVTPASNDILVSVNNGAVSPTPLANLAFLLDPTNNGAVMTLNTGGGTQARPIKYTVTLNQFASTPF